MAKRSGLAVEDVVALGGTEDDIGFLEGVDSSDASELEFNDDTAVTADYDMVRSYLRTLGVHKEQDKTKKAKKTAKSKLSDNNSSVHPVPTSEEDDSKATSTVMEKKLLKLTSNKHNRLLLPLDSEEEWFKQSESEVTTLTFSQTVLDHVTQLGSHVMSKEVELYEKVRAKVRGASEVRWLQGVMSGGTLSDKMASLTLLVQESPVHSLSAMSGLTAMASKKGKRESILAIESLKDLWLTVLLPDDRKLKSWNQRPLNVLVDGSLDPVGINKKLLLWYYEDQVKTKFAKYVSLIQALSHDPVANVREKMLGIVFDLLYRKPEQERELLSQLVNKLGDPVKKVASKAGFFLLKFVDHHGNMKSIVAGELDRLIYRPNISQKAQYYCFCTLNQFSIPQGDSSLAAQLIDTYFRFFKGSISKRDLDGKMLSALLTGVNRAFPFIDGDLPSLESHLQSLFKIVHVGPLATGIQSLMLLYHVMESQQGVSARYYQALYAKLTDPRLKNSGKQAIFLNLLFKSVKFDPEVGRVKAFMKRILQVCCGHTPSFVCGCLFMLSEVLKLRDSLWSFILQSESSDEVLDMSRRKSYDPFFRNPLYCAADTTCLWELAVLQSHYHPSVQTFANKMAAGEYIQYGGDPLLDFSYMKFLDKFVCKNPKQKQSDHGGSIMQRVSVVVKGQQKESAVSAAHFTSLVESKVRDEDRFMFKYFTEKAEMEARAQSRKKKKRSRKSSDGSDGSEDEHSESGGGAAPGAGLDFAGELEMQEKFGRKGRRVESGQTTGMDEDISDDECVSDVVDSDRDSLVDGGAGEGDLGEAYMEKLLLQNLSEDDMDDDDDDTALPGRPHSKKRKRDVQSQEEVDPSSMFAAAEEFAHLLEDGGSKSVEDKYAVHRARQSSWPKKRPDKKRPERPDKKRPDKKPVNHENRTGRRNRKQTNQKTGQNHSRRHRGGGGGGHKNKH